MRRFVKQFGKIHCELEIEIDDDPSTQCFLTFTSYSSSLCMASASGELENGNGDVYQVSPLTMARIEFWAERKGY